MSTLATSFFTAAIAIVFLRLGQRRYAFPGAGGLLFVIQLGIAIACLVRAPAESAYGAGALVVGGIVWFVWKRAK